MKRQQILITLTMVAMVASFQNCSEAKFSASEAAQAAMKEGQQLDPERQLTDEERRQQEEQRQREEEEKKRQEEEQKRLEEEKKRLEEEKKRLEEERMTEEEKKKKEEEEKKRLEEEERKRKEDELKAHCLDSIHGGKYGLVQLAYDEASREYYNAIAGSDPDKRIKNGEKDKGDEKNYEKERDSSGRAEKGKEKLYLYGSIDAGDLSDVQHVYAFDPGVKFGAINKVKHLHVGQESVKELVGKLICVGDVKIDE